jgi:transcription elongation GreA/GreB family factor
MGAPPALTSREREMFERELIDVERRLPELRARGERLLALPDAEVSKDELDDVIEDVGMLENWAIRLRELLARAPSISASASTPGEARLHSHVRVRLQDESEVWYRIVVSVEAIGPHPGVTNVF